MKYIQVYKNKQITKTAILIETINGKTIILTKAKRNLYNCFSTAKDSKDVFFKLYGDITMNTDYLDQFNTVLVDWIQSSILKSMESNHF